MTTQIHVGPWTTKVRELAPYAFTLHEPNGRRVAKVAMTNFADSVDFRTNPKALVIIEAPNLLATLKDFVNSVGSVFNTESTEGTAIYVRACELIARIEGGHAPVDSGMEATS